MKSCNICKTFFNIDYMNLIKWKNNSIEITPEAYGIKTFRNIWNADRTQSKDKAITTLTTLYFYVDPRSEFQYIVEDEERLKEIIIQTGLPTNWKPDKLFNEAIEIYKKLVTTTSSLILQDNRIMVDKIRKYCNELDLKEDVDNNGKPIHTLSSLTKSTSDLNKLAIEISRAEKEIHKEIEEISVKMRGKGSINLCDEGLDFMLD